MILQSRTMISGMLSLCCISCASKTYPILSPVLFQQSLHISLLIHRIFYYYLDCVVCIIIYLCEKKSYSNPFRRHYETALALSLQFLQWNFVFCDVEYHISRYTS